jgi:hypothetical protein
VEHPWCRVLGGARTASAQDCLPLPQDLGFDKKLNVSGTVTEWLWANPHCFLKIDGRNDKGEVTHWIVETSNPQDMVRQGWARNSFKPGDEISLTITPAKNDRPVGRFAGKELVLNGKPFPPATQ